MIFALKGPAQCGKSTLASYLEKELQSRGFNVKRTAFGDFVREEIADDICYLHEQAPFTPGRTARSFEVGKFYESLEHEFGIPGHRDRLIVYLQKRPADERSRVIQQWWGQDFRRAQDPLYWIKASFATNCEFILGSGNNILIEESCRQENEGHYTHALGGIVLDLKPLPSPTAAEEAAMSHSVEQAAMSWKGDIEIDMGWVFKLDDMEKRMWVRDIVSDCLIRMGLTAGRIEDPH